MKIFMLGWEFPPFISGGLGTACYGLTKAMSELGVEIQFVLPRVIDDTYSYATHVDLLTPGDDVLFRGEQSSSVSQISKVSFQIINSPLQPYSTPEIYQHRIEEILRRKSSSGQTLTASGRHEACLHGGDYSGDMYTEVHRYASVASNLASHQQFDIIHAHDWMTYPAGAAVAALTGKPLVVHVHSCDFDRSGEHVNQMIYDIERSGMNCADKVIAVSQFTRNIIIERYGIPADKVEVVHNGVDRRVNGQRFLCDAGISKDEKIVLFLGRITMQKGPEYFLSAAKKVLEVLSDVKFVVAGAGDMMPRMIEMAAESGIGSKVFFTGFLRGEELEKIYKMADLYVMPSVSEPFGIVPLEALNNDVPVIISKQSGVSEVLHHVLKVDFWDVNEIANKIIAILQYPPLRITLQNHGNYEVRKLRWQDSAAKCLKIYQDMLVPA